MKKLTSNFLHCPYCSAEFEETPHTYLHRPVYFYADPSLPDDFSGPRIILFGLSVDVLRCPKCGRFSFSVKSDSYGNQNIGFRYPPYNSRPLPAYLPESIQQDYLEACAIVDSSPKASATLSRRCLQGMIRDFWGIEKNTLNQEIQALKDLIPQEQWTVIDSVRKIGNIGAHMEKDVNQIIDIEPEEARTLLAFIELLVSDWYINKHEREELYTKIVGINQKKQKLREHTKENS